MARRGQLDLDGQRRGPRGVWQDLREPEVLGEERREVAADDLRRRPPERLGTGHRDVARAAGRAEGPQPPLDARLVLDRADLTDADLSGAHLTGARFLATTFEREPRRVLLVLVMPLACLGLFAR